jgi:DNA-directed RNA polymerase specialized sigma subunit
MMDKKEYMLQVRKLDMMITNKLAEVEHWKCIATSTTTAADGERVQSSGSKQKMADAVARYIDIEREINADIDRLIDKKQEIIRTIEQLPTVEYDILHKMYIQNMDFYKVADSYGKSYSWATSMHGKALSDLQKILDGKEWGE